MPTKKTTTKRRSNPTWTEAQWREHGYRRVIVRVPEEDAEALDALAESLGLTRGQAFSHIVRAAMKTRG